MTASMTLFGLTLPIWLWAILIGSGWVVGWWTIKRIVLRSAARLADKTSLLLDDAILRSLDAPLNCLILGSALLVTSRVLPLAAEFRQAVAQGFKALLIIALALGGHRLTRELLATYAPRIDFLRTYHGLVQGITQGAILTLGGLILLDSFGISITPILASLGIGSLAVALALQDTLANFFAGIHVIVDQPVQLGQFVRLESGEEGYVTHIGWRSTRIRMLPNNEVIVPNAKLAGSIITNYYYPDKELAVLVQVGVHYQSDLARVERITNEVAKQIMREVPGGVPTFEPLIRYHTFGDSSINFTAVMRAKEFADQYLIKHEFIKRLHVRYQQEGITIPFPIRTLELSRTDLELLRSSS